MVLSAMAGAGDVDYEVEKFLNKRITDSRVEYFVRWKGFPPDYDTWEPAENLSNCVGLIKKFEQTDKASAMAARKHANKLVVKSKLAKKDNLKGVSLKGKGKNDLTNILKKNADKLSQKKLSGSKEKKGLKISKKTSANPDRKTNGGKLTVKRRKIEGDSVKGNTKKKKMGMKWLLDGNLCSDNLSTNNRKSVQSHTVETSVVSIQGKQMVAQKTKSDADKVKKMKPLTKVQGKSQDGENCSDLKKSNKQHKKTSCDSVTLKKNNTQASPVENMKTPSRKHLLFSKKSSPLEKKNSKLSPGSSGKKDKNKKREFRISIDALLGFSNRKSQSLAESLSKSEKKEKSRKSLFETKDSCSQEKKIRMVSGQKRKAEDLIEVLTDTDTSGDEDSDSDILYSLVESSETVSDLGRSGSQNDQHSQSSKVSKSIELQEKKKENSHKAKNIHKTLRQLLESSPSQSVEKSKKKKIRLIDSLKTSSVKSVMRPVSPTPVYTTVKSVISDMDPTETTPPHQNCRGDIPTYQYVVQPSAVIPVSPSSMSYKMLLENLPQQMHPKKNKKKTAEEEDVERRMSVRQSERVFRYKEILIKKCQKYTQIWLNTRTKMKNALNPQVIEEIVSALTAAKFDDSNVVMISGLGNVFCSGVDLGFLTSGDRKMAARQMVDALRDFTKAIVTFPKPLVAVVTGPAIGLGMTMLPLCDLVYASDKATFYLPYTQLAQTPEGCASYTLPQALGMAMATDLLIGGRRITAIEACQLGLISQVFWPTSMMQEVIPRLQTLALQSNKVLETTKLLIRSHQRTKLDLTCETESNLLLELWPSPECQKAITDYMNNEKNFSF